MKTAHDASGRPAYEFEHLRSSRYDRISSNLKRRFKLLPEGRRVDTEEEKYQEYSAGRYLIALGWINGKGYVVNSQSPDSDQLASDIANYIKKKY